MFKTFVSLLSGHAS